MLMIIKTIVNHENFITLSWKSLEILANCLPLIGAIKSRIAPFFLTRELRACARASCRYNVENGTRSLDWSIPVNFFSILGF